MAKVNYTPRDKNEVFCNLSEGTYFDYLGTLYLLVCEQNGIVFDFVDGASFCWYNVYASDTPVRTISSDKITIQVD